MAVFFMFLFIFLIILALIFKLLSYLFIPFIVIALGIYIYRQIFGYKVEKQSQHYYRQKKASDDHIIDAEYNEVSEE